MTAEALPRPLARECRSWPCENAVSSGTELRLTSEPCVPGARLGVPMPGEQAPRRGGGGGGPVVQPVDDDDDEEEPDDVDDDFPAGMPAHAYPGGPFPPGRDAGLPDMPEVGPLLMHLRGSKPRGVAPVSLVVSTSDFDCNARIRCEWPQLTDTCQTRAGLWTSCKVFHSRRQRAALDSSLIAQGVDLEEARMLEAAMFGVAYQGRMPDYNGVPGAGAYGGARGRGGHQPLDPHVLENRMLREEQEIAYQESLQVRRVDRALKLHKIMTLQPDQAIRWGPHGCALLRIAQHSCPGPASDQLHWQCPSQQHTVCTAYGPFSRWHCIVT